jgi:O-6-methylguanine DNA methyltransferase
MMKMQSSNPPADHVDQRLAQLAEDSSVDPCDIACEAMPGYAIGDLVPEDEEWIHTHTATCRYCRNEMESFVRLDSLLDTAEPKVEFVPMLQVRVRRERTVARWGLVDSPVGDLYVAASDGGICEISFGRKGSAGFFADLARRGYVPVDDQAAIADASRQLAEYFSGSRATFELPVDLAGLTPFTRQVLDAATAVPFGALVTYRDIATAIGKPSASRAVGNALGRNPVPVIVPCHRIVRSDRSIGGYTGGLDIKHRLLALEGATLPSPA